MNEASNWPARTGKRLLVSLLAVALAGGCGSSPAGPADAATSLDAADAGDALPFTIEAHCERDMLWFPLPAELSVYSRALDRVVLASAQHRVLWIAEPSVCAARALVLPQPAMGLALNVAETRAVVGLAGAVVAIDLQSAELGPTLATPSEASGVSVDWRGGVHTAKVGFDGDVDRSPIVSLDTNTGQTRLGPLVDNAGVFVTHPLGRTLYWVSTRFERVAAFDLSASIAVPIASFHDGSAGDVRTCGLLAFAPDGQLAVTGCGTVLRTTNDGFELVPAQRDELAEARAVHVSGGRVALIPALPYPPADSNGEGLPVHLYDLATRKLLQGFEPPRLVPSARPRPARAFLNAGPASMRAAG